MNMYWVYELPSWLFGVLTIVVTVAVGLSGLYATRRWARRVHGDRHSHNELVGYYLGAVCVFYGITLGLLAVAAWQTYSDVETKVGEEAAAVGALYRDVSTFPEPSRTELQSDLRRYVRQIIDVAWPEQRQGIVPQEEGVTLSTFQTHLIGFEPVTESQKAIYAEAYRGFDLVFRHAKPSHALLDDGIPVCASRPVDLYAWRIRQTFPRGDQRQFRTV